MGVRGLTTYIAKNAEKYLEPYELHDCNLVIDGDSLASNLYRWSPNCPSAFGGNYDQYFRDVCNFFALLKQCNVTAYVILDGGYQRRKLRTVESRMRSKVATIKYLNPASQNPIFPLLMREVFVEAVEHCQVPLMRCVFEADDEVAVLARKLNCPLLSYDSDFYIHNVQYIPSVTLTMKVYKKTIVMRDGTGATGQTCHSGKTAMKKKFKKKEFVQEMPYDGHLVHSSKKNSTDDGVKSYYYLDCCLYTIKNLVEKKGLHDDMLPLFAVLLGNDYIKISIFGKFYRNVSLKGHGKKNSKQSKRIMAILQWLQNQTVESAITSVLSRMPKERRPWLQNQIESAMSGYNNEECQSFKFFGFEHKQKVEKNETLKALMNNVTSVELVEGDGDDHDGDGDDSSGTASEASESEITTDDDDDDDVVDDEPGGTGQKTEPDHIRPSDAESDDEGPFKDDPNHKYVYETYTPPGWIAEPFQKGKLPRYIIDLLHLHFYVNAPQVENCMLPDAHQISLPILKLIFSVLHYPAQPTLRYLTRVQRVAQIHYKKLECLPLDQSPYRNDGIDIDGPATFRLAFKDFDNFDDICRAISSELPPEYQLLAFCIIYWAKNSAIIDKIHIISVVMSLLVLSVIDQRIEPLRSRDRFHQKYGAQLKSMPCQRNGTSGKSAIPTPDADATATTAIQPKTESLQSLSSILSSIKKLECIYAQNNLLAHFELHAKTRNRHTDISNTILHGFAELQAIVLQLNCLNTLCSLPYSCVSISKLYNGSFLYNIYMALKDRPDPFYYLKNFIFDQSPGLLQVFHGFISFFEPFVRCLATASKSTSKVCKIGDAPKKQNKKKKKAKKDATKTTDIPCNEHTDAVIPLSESDFEDVNNKFACLLNIK